MRFTAKAVLMLMTVAAALPVQSAGQQLIYSVNRTPEPVFSVARAAQVITSDEIRRINARTVPELLMEKGLTFVQQTNYGGGSPIMRGMMGKHILILIDGVKMNNATYRFGPLQYLNTIDLASVERIEIVRGVGSVLGADALGGQINIITKKGYAGNQSLHLGGGAQSRASSGDEGWSGHGEIYQRADKYRVHAGATYRNSGDVRGGDGMGIQTGTGYDEVAGNVVVEVPIGGARTMSFSYRALEQRGVPRTDRLTNGSNLVFDFDPQRLQLGTVTFQDFEAAPWLDHLQLTAQWNKQDEGRIEVRASNPDVERRLRDSQTMLTLNLELASFIGESQRLLYGVDFSTEGIESTRSDVDLTTAVSTAKRGQFTDGATYRSVAAYIQDRISLGQVATFTLGGRVNGTWAGGHEETSVGMLHLSSSSVNVTGTGNVVFHVSPNFNLVGIVTRGFRAPNLDDISVYDERSNGTEVPNTNLHAEIAMTYEAGFKYNSRYASGSAFYYLDKLSNLVERTSGTVNGLSFFDLDGDGLQGANEPNVLQKANIGTATLWGFEFDGEITPHPDFALFGTYAYTRGWDENAEVPLRRVPPAFGTVGARWSTSSKYAPWLEFVSTFAAAQRRLNPGDESDDRIGPDGTDGFFVMTARGGLSIERAVRLVVALENIGNEAYKYHGSGIYRPGRQLVGGVEVRF